MADETRKTGEAGQKIVTLRSLELPASETLEAVSPGPQGAADQLTLARYQQIMERLRQETQNAGAELMITVPDREVSLLQSEISRRADADRALNAGGLEAKFGTGIGGGDWFGWIRSVFDHVDRRVAHPMVRPTTTAAEVIPDITRFALTADWGTGLYGAPRIADQMRQMGPFEVLLHLGDVYYSGTEDEVQQRFLDAWPRTAGRLSRALNSNHEMYSGGFGYFKLALPALGQTSSYFAFQNQHWLLVCLDTAYVDHDMDNEQVAWLNLVIEQANRATAGIRKKVVLFSHQQLFSRLDNQGPKLRQALRHLLDAKGITAWYWGHEHQCVIYDRHAAYGLFGRCLGNGGIPEVRKSEVKQAPTENTVGQTMWKRLSATGDSPSCLVLDGPNRFITGEEEKFVPHGFMTLDFNGPTLTERVFLADGTEMLTNTIS
jgi:hypothetical protein